VTSRTRLDRVVVGALMIVLGVGAVVEARRLHALREAMVAGAVVGDDTFPLIVGAGMILLGVLCVTLRMPAVRVTLPTGTARARMLGGGMLLVANWAMLPSFGYTASTAAVSIALYRAMGGYRWVVATAAGAVTTVLLHLLFRVWLRQPLPSGWLGI
jgi:hypothetical protein